MGEKRKRRLIFKWINATIVAVIITLIVRAFFFQSFYIGNTQMENSLLPGDMIIVNKWKAGARTPITLFSVPFFERSYYSEKQLLDYGTLSWINLKRNDLVLFNYPKETDKPIDKRSQLIQRLVGMPGDKIKIKNKELIVNKLYEEYNPLLKYEYKVSPVDIELPESFFEKYNINKENRRKDDMDFYLLNITEETAYALKNNPKILSIKEDNIKEGIRDVNIFPYEEELFWNRDYFGPITVPYQGMEIDLNLKNYILYKNLIKTYEGKELKLRKNRVVINGILRPTYTFKQNYYFMMGDNRDKTIDSRYWGFLPENHLIGKCSFIWFSFDNSKTGFKKLRWERAFEKCE